MDDEREVQALLRRGVTITASLAYGETTKRLYLVPVHAMHGRSPCSRMLLVAVEGQGAVEVDYTRPNPFKLITAGIANRYAVPICSLINEIFRGSVMTRERHQSNHMTITIE